MPLSSRVPSAPSFAQTTNAYSFCSLFTFPGESVHIYCRTPVVPAVLLCDFNNVTDLQLHINLRFLCFPCYMCLWSCHFLKKSARKSLNALPHASFPPSPCSPINLKALVTNLDKPSNKELLSRLANLLAIVFLPH